MKAITVALSLAMSVCGILAAISFVVCAFRGDWTQAGVWVLVDISLTLSSMSLRIK